jgi:hypothetical protein
MRFGGSVIGRYERSQNTILLAEVKEKLPLEGQQWIAKLNDGERPVIEHQLNIVGEQQFVEHWEIYKNQYDDFTREFGRFGETGRRCYVGS